MKISILHAEMRYSEQEGYWGKVQFAADGHKQPYELTLQSDKRPDDWNYALNFLRESGSEEEIEQVEQAIEADDDLFDDLVEAAMNAMPVDAVQETD